MTEHAPMTEERLREIEARHDGQPADLVAVREDGNLVIECGDYGVVARMDNDFPDLAETWSASRADVMALIAALRHERDAGMVACGACAGLRRAALATPDDPTHLFPCNACDGTGLVPAVAEVERLRLDLAGALDALRVDSEERARLTAIIEGRYVAPTDEEIAAHHRAQGVWIVTTTWEDGTVSGACVGFPRSVREVRDAPGQASTRWVAIATDRPCAWPTP